MLTEIGIKVFADMAWEFLCRKPGATFEDWAKTKSFSLEDKIAIKIELMKPLGRESC